MNDNIYAEKIESVLARVREPETQRSVSELNLVRKVTVSENEKTVLVKTDIADGRSTCLVCGLVTETIRQSIKRALKDEFSKEFPGYAIETD